ncbi:hypothetical protein CRENBAI_008571, partial [Crenichthys baileyi]
NQIAWVQNPDLSQNSHNKTPVPVARRPRDCSPRLGARLVSGARAADPRTERRAREHQVTCPPSSRTRTEPGEPDPRCPVERSRYRPGFNCGVGADGYALNQQDEAAPCPCHWVPLRTHTDKTNPSYLCHHKTDRDQNLRFTQHLSRKGKPVRTGEPNQSVTRLIQTGGIPTRRWINRRARTRSYCGTRTRTWAPDSGSEVRDSEGSGPLEAQNVFPAYVLVHLGSSFGFLDMGSYLFRF